MIIERLSNDNWYFLLLGWEFYHFWRFHYAKSQGSQAKRLFCVYSKMIQGWLKAPLVPIRWSVALTLYRDPDFQLEGVYFVDMKMIQTVDDYRRIQGLLKAALILYRDLDFQSDGVLIVDLKMIKTADDYRRIQWIRWSVALTLYIDPKYQLDGLFGVYLRMIHGL